MADRITRVTTQRPLQSLALGFRNRSLIADRAAPRIRVEQAQGFYRVYGKDQMMVHKATWSPGTIPNAIDFAFTSAQFNVPINKLRTLLPDAVERAADQDLRLRMTKTRQVTNALVIAREKRVADLFTTVGNYPGGNVIVKAGGSEWNVAPGTGGEQPFTDLLTLIGTVAAAAMVDQSELSVIIPSPVFRTALMRNAAVLASISVTQTRVVTAELLAAALGVKEVIIAAAMSAGAGIVNAGTTITGYTTSYLWGDNVWVGLIGEPGDDPDTEAPVFARSLQWNGETAGQDRQVRQYRAADEGQEADWIEVKEAVSEVIVFSSAGGLITNTLSTI